MKVFLEVTKGSTVAVNEFGAWISHKDGRVVVQYVDGSLKKIWAHKIIRRRPAEEFSSGEFPTAPEIPRRTQVLRVGKELYAGILRGVLAAYFGAAVGGSVVRNYEFKIAIRLAEMGIDGGSHVLFAIVKGHPNADTGLGW